MTISNSGLTADWADNAGNEAAIKSSLGKLLDLLQGQIFLLKGANSDSSSGLRARRLTSQQAVLFSAVFIPYPNDSPTALKLDISNLNGDDFIDALTAALQDAAPSGLATATFSVGTPVFANFTVPVARWVALTDWSLCSNECGKGTRTRSVDCLGEWGGDATELCNANAPPGFTKESYMPDSQECELYVSCPYDWSCPSGPDPVTGEGCEGQASGVAVAIAVGVSFCACLCCFFVLKHKRALEGKMNEVLGFKNTNIYWEREEGTVDRTSHQLLHKGQTVEYWSKTIQTWLPAKILGVKVTPYYDNTLKFNALSFDVSAGAAEQEVLGVGMMDLREPLMEGESVRFFSQKHGSWFPARIHKSWRDFDQTLEYDVMLEDVFDDYLETYVKSELQKDLERYDRDNGGRGDMVPVLKKVSAKRLRRRYNSGDRVRVYRGADQGFVEAEVDYEEEEEKPEMEDVALARSPRSGGSVTPPYAAAARSPRSRSPSPLAHSAAGRGSGQTQGSTDTLSGAQSKTGRYHYGGQRHAMVVVRRIRLDDLPEGRMRLPDYVLRRGTASRSQNAPPVRRNLSPRGGAPSRAPTDTNMEEFLVN